MAFQQNQVAFFSSGAEAIENAVKISRKHTKRKAIMVFEGAFCGRTLLTMTMTHKARPTKQDLGRLHRISTVSSSSQSVPQQHAV